MSSATERETSILVGWELPWADEVVGGALRRAGFTVAYASNGVDVLEQVARRRPDVLVMSLVMPYLDSFEVLARLRADPATADIPVVILTPMSAEVAMTQRLQRMVEEQGATPVLMPLKPPDLLRAIRNLIEDRSLEIPDP